MQWSKLKTRFTSLICDELRDRLDFHITSYRKSHDGVAEIWITLDGKKVFAAEHYEFEFAEREGYYAGLAGDELKAWLAKRSVASPNDVGHAMRQYLDMSVREALLSENPFHRAFAIIDRRTGKPALESLVIEGNTHPLIRLFYQVRIERN